MPLPPTFIAGFHYEDEVKRMEYRQYISKQTVHEAFKRGINYIDTAPFYGLVVGESETNIGRILKDVPRQAYYIATKTCRYDRTGPNQFDFSYERTMLSINESLRRLGVDYIDLYQLHDVEFADNVDEVINGAFKACLELKKSGKIRAIGINGYPLNVLKEGLIKGEGNFDTVLTYARYLVTDNSLLAYLPFFEDQKVGVINAALTGCGLLTNRPTPVWHSASKELNEIVNEASRICFENRVELGKLSTYHCLNIPNNDISTFLVGMEKMEYLNHNMNAYLDGLTDKEAEIYELLMKTIFSRIREEVKHWEGVEVKRYRLQRNQ